jgi:5-methylcytosine-specific restriction endonuclease McrA
MKGTKEMSVFVLDQRKRPLMPCSERRARLLLSRKRAVVHRVWPFTIRLKDRSREASQVQSVALKLDPGSNTTGMALVRIEQTQDGEVHHAVHLAELSHRGQVVHRVLQQRASYRHRRRSANLRHRPPRFANRGRQSGWLPPSLRSRIGNVLTWAHRYARWAPLSRIEVERVKFDTALLQNPEISGILYQRGELCGWEIRSYLLEKFGRRCVYCGRGKTAFEIDHVVPRSRGGTYRVSNLVLSCHDCNRAKGDQTAAEFGHPHVEGEAERPLQDAAAVNATRFALVEALAMVGLPIGRWSGGRTRWNRDRLGIEKAHCLDALCVGEVTGVRVPVSRPLSITAQGRGSYRRTNVDASGFPRGYLMREKRMQGFSTGDLVRARVPERLKTGGVHVGRVAVRGSGAFRVGKIDGISAKYCRVVQRADGYSYALQEDTPGGGASSPRVNAGPPRRNDGDTGHAFPVHSAS